MPPTHQHALWQAWDLACDACLSQLDRMVNRYVYLLLCMLALTRLARNIEYVHSSFFGEHLTAFELWLDRGAIDRRKV